MTTGFVSERPGGCVLAVRVVPRAGRTGITGARDGSVIVRVAAPPAEGAANTAVIGVLAEALHIPRSAVTILRGGRGRDKLIDIDGLGAQVVASRIEDGLAAAASDRGR